jgi:hypothetical protein
MGTRRKIQTKKQLGRKRNKENVGGIRTKGHRRKRFFLEYGGNLIFMAYKQPRTIFLSIVVIISNTKLLKIIDGQRPSKRIHLMRKERKHDEIFFKG